jgi:hypothetical protein
MVFKIVGIDLGIRDEDDKPVYSAVLSEVDYTDDPGQGKAKQGKNQTMAVEALQKAIAEHTPVSGSPSGVPLDLWRDKCAAIFESKTRFYEIKKSLLRRGRISIEEDYVSLV